jgi:hypothetical protein
MESVSPSRRRWNKRAGRGQRYSVDCGTTHKKPCALLVFNPPVHIATVGEVIELRRTFPRHRSAGSSVSQCGRTVRPRGILHAYSPKESVYQRPAGKAHRQKRADARLLSRGLRFVAPNPLPGISGKRPARRGSGLEWFARVGAAKAQTACGTRHLNREGSGQHYGRVIFCAAVVRAFAKLMDLAPRTTRRRIRSSPKLCVSTTVMRSRSCRPLQVPKAGMRIGFISDYLSENRSEP